MTCRADAAGGVDGVKNGKWGFHTQNEPNPWWQVDLQKRTPIDRVLLYNRCDLPDRIGRMMLLLSDDGKMFKRVWQNDGTIFYGFTDKKPLEVRLHGVQARFVRLQLPLTSYFHLDEVEIYPVGEGRNIALGKPADQSSVSEWSTKRDAPVPPEVRPQNYALGTAWPAGASWPRRFGRWARAMPTFAFWTRSPCRPSACRTRPAACGGTSTCRRGGPCGGWSWPIRC